MKALKENLIEILLQNKLLTQEQLDRAVKIQNERRIPLRRVLIDEKIIGEEQLLQFLSTHLYIPSLHLSKYKFDPELVKIIPAHMALQYTVIPISKIANTLTVAMADPLNVFALDDLKVITGCDIDIVLSPIEEISRAIEAHYVAESKDMQELIDAGVDTKEQGKEDVQVVKDEDIDLSSAVSESEKPSIVKLVDVMLTEALKKRASDLHIEPVIDGLKVRYRVDGALHEIIKLPKKNQNAVTARLKIISNMNITENRIPQDGRFKVKFEGKEIDFRVSSLPTTFGQKFVLRVLDKGQLSIGLDKLGFSPEPARIFKEAVAKPFGMILVTGPTGSGKSTTLYSVLNQLNTPQRNIVTIEDPVEYQLDGITQIPVRHDIGLDFSAGLRAVLRQSPDVIMVGEIRDSETADIAVKASLTGQLFLSTLHTNDALTSITRLMDMGVDPFLVATSIVMVCAQRLCRRMCPKCRKPVTVPAAYLKEIGFPFEGVTFYKAEGCKSCNNTGIYGRIAILEAVLIDDTIREMIIKKQSLDSIREYAVTKLGMKMLRDDAFIKVKDGMTTLDEAIRITTEE
ncbi:MAG TPA: GspE/PulE family protein [Candidatus Omnitrophota bacterium]|nr:Flp pilus assembly complex ATPase component TadA [Candidatus Omnitrophota bacterium]MDD4940529.1 GspE/PulE family protein [Candidatus Omnitrophota bacterium]HNQ51451.1 GspE/PulE family protein [Candidatus Omnitrophota bacterium]